MNSKSIQARLTRLQRECDVSAAPALLLLVGGIVFVVMLALGGGADETPPVQATQPTPATAPAAS